MKTLKKYTQEEYMEESDRLIKELISKGWDDTIMYHFEAFTTSYRKSLEEIFDQPQAFPPDAFEKQLPKPVKSFGLGVSFGGVKLTGTPNFDSIVHFFHGNALHDEEVLIELNKSLKEMLDHGPEKAEEQAKKSRSKLSKRMIPDAYRVFLRVLIPVKFVE